MEIIYIGSNSINIFICFQPYTIITQAIPNNREKATNNLYNNRRVPNNKGYKGINKKDRNKATHIGVTSGTVAPSRKKGNGFNRERHISNINKVPGNMHTENTVQFMAIEPPTELAIP